MIERDTSDCRGEIYTKILARWCERSLGPLIDGNKRGNAPRARRNVKPNVPVNDVDTT